MRQEQKAALEALVAVAKQYAGTGLGFVLIVSDPDTGDNEYRSNMKTEAASSLLAGQLVHLESMLVEAQFTRDDEVPQ